MPFIHHIARTDGRCTHASLPDRDRQTVELFMATWRDDKHSTQEWVFNGPSASTRVRICDVTKTWIEEV